MDFQDLFTRLAVALGIGLLFGLERGWKARDDAPGSRTAGIRTFALTGLLGGVVGAMAHGLGSASPAAGVLLGLSFAVFAAIFAVFCRDENRAEGSFSATTTVAGMLTFALGAYALLGADLRAPVAAAVAAAFLLAQRDVLHDWVEKITWRELRATLVLLTMTFVAMPLLPDEPVGLLGGLNPRAIWLVAIVLAGVSFLGYAAVKIFGARYGVLLAAAAGGLVSSTAVMAMNARRAAAGEGEVHLLAAGATLATAVSIIRTAVIVAVMNAALLPIAGPALAGAGLAAVVTALLLAFRRKAEDGADFDIRNPFELKTVIGFAALLGAITVIGRVLSEQFGAAGAILAALATGLADVDAVTVSMARLAPGTLDPATAGYAVLAAVASNTLSKLAIGLTGRGAFARWVAASSGVAFAAGGAALWAGMAWS